MSPVDFALHLLGFAAPALVVGVLAALAGRWLLPAGRGPGWLGSILVNTAVGLAVLVAGLWHFGRDGKMATYAALVLVVASVQWLAGRGWRG